MRTNQCHALVVHFHSCTKSLGYTCTLVVTTPLSVLGSTCFTIRRLMELLELLYQHDTSVILCCFTICVIFDYYVFHLQSWTLSKVCDSLLKSKLDLPNPSWDLNICHASCRSLVLQQPLPEISGVMNKTDTQTQNTHTYTREKVSLKLYFT